MHIAKTRDERLGAFLDAAQGLFLTRGYEETTIAAIIDAVGVSKGAFYHYFDGKEDLLDAIAERAADSALALVEPIASDARRSAVERINAVFAASTGFKAKERGLMMTFLRVLYDDKNLRLRKRIENRNKSMLAPLFAAIIRQGTGSGELEPCDPDEAAIVLLDLGTALSERIASEAIRAASGPSGTARASLDGALRGIRGYQEAASRVVGAKPGAIRMVEDDIAGLLIGEGGA